MRSKKGKSAEDRMRAMLSNPVSIRHVMNIRNHLIVRRIETQISYEMKFLNEIDRYRVLVLLHFYPRKKRQNSK